MPNLGAADATLREATLAALANIWKEDERRWAAVTPPDARRDADGDGNATFVAPRETGRARLDDDEDGDESGGRRPRERRVDRDSSRGGARFETFGAEDARKRSPNSAR